MPLKGIKCSLFICFVLAIVACGEQSIVELVYFNSAEIADIIEEPVKLAEPVQPVFASHLEDTIEEELTMTELEATPSKKIALTFDDGPHDETTPLILELLNKHEAKATFFMLGKQAELYPDIVKQVFNDGHEIGNHTWDHPDLTLLDAEDMIQQFESTRDMIAAITGEAPMLIRPPYGKYDEAVQNIAPGPLINWSIDTIDWQDRDADQIMVNITDAVHEDGIILMHDVYPSTVEAVERILNTYGEQGYEFVTVSELLHFDRSEPVNGKVYKQKL